MNDHDQALLDSFLAGNITEAPVRQLLPPGYRCSAYWFCWQAGLLTGDWAADLEFMRELGWHAAVLARAWRIPPWCCDEGPFWVNTWPEQVWSVTADAMMDRAAEHGDMTPAWSTPPPSGGYRDGNY